VGCFLDVIVASDAQHRSDNCDSGSAQSGLEDECDAASAGSAFLHAVERKLQSEPDSIGPIMSDLMPAVEFVAMNPERYSTNREIW
jgi:hypothetical protein